MNDMSFVAPIGSLDSYISYVKQIPRLSEEEEKKYAIDVYENNSHESAKMLILSNLKIVVYIAYQLKGYNVAISDMVQEGNIGLMKAIKTFNPYIGTRLISHAVKYIKYEMYELVRKTSKIFKLYTTKRQKKIFFNISKHKKIGKWMTTSEMDNMSKLLNVPIDDIKYMESVMYCTQEMPLYTHNEDGEIFELPLLASDDYNPIHSVESHQTEAVMEKIKTIVDTFDDRYKDIFYNRMLVEDKPAFKFFAEKYGVSPQRIEQIEGKIINRLKKELQQ